MSLITDVGDISEWIWNEALREIDQSETSITESIVLKLLSNNNVQIAFKSPEEAIKGADIEWWIINEGCEKGKAIGLVLRIQAKKLKIRARLPWYEELDHIIGKESPPKYQINQLISESIKDSMIPLYCFYNYLEEKSSYKPREDGWRYSLAHSIITNLVDVDGDFLKFKKNYKEVNSYTLSMTELANQIIYNQGNIIDDLFSIKHSTLSGKKKADFYKKSVDFPQYIHEIYRRMGTKGYEKSKQVREWMEFFGTSIAPPSTRYILITFVSELFGQALDSKTQDNFNQVLKNLKLL